MVRRPHAFAVALAVAVAVFTVTAAVMLGLPLRDPDGIAGPSYVRLPGIIAIFFCLDVLPRAFLRARSLAEVGSAAREVIREQWTPNRVRLVLLGLLSFYACYVGYRNLKGFLPFVRDGLADAALARVDRALLLGNDPAALLQGLLGTGAAAHLLSWVYISYLLFVPLSLAAALVWNRNVRCGFYYVTALCINWVVGAASYYLLPSLGPVFVEPNQYADLPFTAVARLQQGLANSRLDVLADPFGTASLQGIAGFASLHVSVVFSAALIAHRLGLRPQLRWALWAYLGLTIVSTIYFGWHYLLDDVAGLAIGWFAAWLAGVVTAQGAPEALDVDTVPVPEPGVLSRR